MKFDHRLGTGLLIGMVLGLHYHEALVVYLPLLIIAALIFLIKMVHH